MAAHVPAFCACGRCPDDIAEKVCCKTEERWASAADRGTCVTTTARFRRYAADRAHLTKTGTAAPPRVPAAGRALWISRARRRGHNLARARAPLPEQARPCAGAAAPTRAGATLRAGDVARARQSGKPLPRTTEATLLRRAAYQVLAQTFGPGGGGRRPLPCCVLAFVRTEYAEAASAEHVDAPGAADGVVQGRAHGARSTRRAHGRPVRWLTARP